ncbi:hypothetical protein H2200_005939 [Cladophialophora chaetospira]|uniref:Major facilitator superfamily (MFS) profile domain-containing protein n=1 Tax=Cladophialophora chaetospira TaxID=386627 RepID=A0AA38XA47_9EURO|nr:hypothetical protein H2200_005939 [Cladophialophora chaetospira]
MDNKDAVREIEVVEATLHNELALVEAQGKVTFKDILVVLAVASGFAGTILHLVGSGLLPHSITAVVGGNDKLVWITAVITFHSIVLTPSICQAADFYGRKWLMVVTLIAGGVGCIIVSRANNIGTVIVGQAIGGLALIVQALSTAVNSEILPRKYRGWAVALTYGPSGGAAIVAILVAGAMSENNPEGFRHYFYLVAAFYIVSGAVIAIAYNPPLRETQRLTWKEKLYGLDLPGSGLLVVALLGICLALSWSDNPYGWGDAHVLASFIVGCSAAVATALYAIFIRKDGFFHHGLFSRNFTLAECVLFVDGIVFICANNYLGYQLSVMYGTSSWTTSLIYSISWFVFIVAAPLAGFFITRFRRPKAVANLGFAFFTLYFVLMATTNLHSQIDIWGYNVFLGIGLGLAIEGLMVIAQLSTPPDLISSATGLTIATRTLGAAVGLVVFNAIINSALKSKLVPSITRAALSHGLPIPNLGAFLEAVLSNDPASAAKVPGVTDEILQVVKAAQQHVFNIGFRNVYIAAACFCVKGLVATIFLKDPMQEFTAAVDAPLNIREKEPSQA